MKNIIKIAVMVLTRSLLCSCGAISGNGGNSSGSENEGGGESGPEFVIKARVNAVGEKIEVDVIEGEYAYGIYWVITSEQTEFLGKDGGKITKNDIKPGDTLEIVYNGQVMMSYPPQIVARKITVL